MLFHNLIIVFGILSILVPMAGAVHIFGKRQSHATMALIVSCLSCSVMNAVTLLCNLTESNDVAYVYIQTAKIAQAAFLVFVVIYLSETLRLPRKKLLTSIWLIVEMGILFLHVYESRSNETIYVTRKFWEKGQVYLTDLKTGPMYMINYAVLLMVLVVGVAFTFYRLRQNDAVVRNILAYLIGAELMLLGTVVTGIAMKPPCGVISLLCTLMLAILLVPKVRDGVISDPDAIRDWTFAHNRNGLVITDNTFQIVVRNHPAANLIKECGESGELDFKVLAEAEESDVVLNHKWYHVTKTDIKNVKGKLIGYCFSLANITTARMRVEDAMTRLHAAERERDSKTLILNSVFHEIRNPMNTISGMTEILLRGDLTGRQQGYLMNIRNSGNAMLQTVNDMIDFEAIDSGSVEFTEEEYNLTEMISGMAMTLQNRIGDRNLELLLDVDPSMPKLLFGPAGRLRQILINVAGAVISYAEEGSLFLKVAITERSADGLELEFSTTDLKSPRGEAEFRTALEKFSSDGRTAVTDVDANRLAVSVANRLIDRLGGKIRVEHMGDDSYTVAVSIRQKIADQEKAVSLKNPDKKLVIGAVTVAESTLESIRNLVENYGMTFVDFGRSGDQKLDYLFTDSPMYGESQERINKLVKEGTTVCILQNPMKYNYSVNRVTIVNKPLFTLNFCQTINREREQAEEQREEYIRFTAPEARILVVDDNAMNLKVVKGLMKSMGAQIDTADNGADAIAMVEKAEYDLIFMDHMMPVMDGVEATERIRAKDSDYFRNVPIIALTANALSDARMAFADAGMNDFLPKPINQKALFTKLHKWLPEQLICPDAKPAKTGEEQPEEDDLPDIEGINKAQGIRNSGSRELFVNLLGDFYKLIDMKASKIEKCLEDEMIHDYTIEVHGLKNTARMIGATELSDLFFLLELYGHDNDVTELRERTPGVMELYRSYKGILKPFGMQNERDKKEGSTDEIISLLEAIREGTEAFDLDTVDDALKQLDELRLPEDCVSEMENLRAFVADVAMEDIISCTESMTRKLRSSE